MEFIGAPQRDTGAMHRWIGVLRRHPSMASFLGRFLVANSTHHQVLNFRFQTLMNPGTTAENRRVPDVTISAHEIPCVTKVLNRIALQRFLRPPSCLAEPDGPLPSRKQDCHHGKVGSVFSIGPSLSSRTYSHSLARPSAKMVGSSLGKRLCVSCGNGPVCKNHPYCVGATGNGCRWGG